MDGRMVSGKDVTPISPTGSTTTTASLTNGRDKREYDKERQRKWRSANPNRSKRASATPRLPFVGVDGEGYDTIDGRHVYNMLRAGGWFLAPEDGRDSLDTWECLDFLAELSTDVIYVAYFFDYDVTKILEQIGWYKLARLMDRDGRKSEHGNPWPVDLKEGLYQVEYMPRKHFKVRKQNGIKDGKPTYNKWTVINDVGPFFQCRFVQALEQWKIGTADERAAIALGKDARNSHRAEDFERVRGYNALECKLLADLMEQFRDACVDVGYIPRQWQGPGQIAEAMLHQNGIPKSKEVGLLTDPRNERLLTFARNAFYGGRPEISAVGHIQFPVIQWDINSAYPYALENVPCLEHGRFNHVVVESRHKRMAILAGDQSGLDIKPLGIYYGSFDFNGKGHPPSLYGLPIRSETGTISYPRRGRGWYWGFEILASVHQRFDATEGFEYVETCSCVPFSWVRKIYATRKAMGKDARGIVLKLALNSLYGKMAQSIGSPKYANPIWASFITAFCRTQIQDAIHSCHAFESKCGRGIWMIATDAIFTSYDLPIKEGGGLGQFSKEVHPKGIFLVQPGLYFRGNGGKPKTRGVPQALVIEHEQEFRENFIAMSAAGNMAVGSVRMELRSFVGIRQALHRHNLSILGQWVRTTKTISFDWTNKRQPGFAHRDFDNNHINTGPREGRRDLETVPYSKDIGKILELQKLDSMDQPDWADQISSMEEM